MNRVNISVALLIVFSSNNKSYCYNILNAINRPSVTLKSSRFLHTNKDRDPHEQTCRQHTLRLFSVTNYDSPHCIHGELDQLISFAHSPEEELLPVVSDRSPLQSLCVSSLLKTGGQQEEMNA